MTNMCLNLRNTNGVTLIKIAKYEKLKNRLFQFTLFPILSFISQAYSNSIPVQWIFLKSSIESKIKINNEDKLGYIM